MIYLGFIRNHWGHFLLDCSTRLWYAKSHPNFKCVFCVKLGESFSPIENIDRFLELYGIKKNRILYVNSAQRFRNIIVPKPSYCTNTYYSDQFLNMFDDVASGVDLEAYPKHEKIYFTRRKFRKAVTTEYGENFITDILSYNGFTIVSPENCSLDEQIAFIRNSNLVSTINGTIAHNMLFARKGQEIHIFNKTYIKNMMQFDVDYLRHLNTVYIDAYCARYPSSLGWGPFALIPNENFMEYINDYEYTIPKAFEREKVIKRTLSKYIRAIRSNYINSSSIEYEKSPEKVNYMPPELVLSFDEKYYCFLNKSRVSSRFLYYYSKMRKKLSDKIDYMQGIRR